MKQYFKFSTFTMSLISLSFIFTACNDVIGNLDEREVMSKRFEESIEVAKNHSNMVDIIMQSLAQTRADGGDCQEALNNMFLDYIKENDLDDIFNTQESIDRVIHPIDIANEINKTIGNDFVDDLEQIIEDISDNESLRESLLNLLISNDNNQNIDDMLIMAGIAVDSYDYWKSQAETRGILSVATRIVRADVLSAGAFLCECGAAALVTGATPPGAGVVALTAGFGSTCEAITMAYE